MPHLGVYAAAGLYDLAFGYRDCDAETRFLLEIFRRRRGRAARSFFELAAGPGRHALSAGTAGLAVTALDLSPQMAAYTLEKATRAGVELRYLIADMTSFEPPGTFDLAACMLCSAGYLLTDDAVLSHLSSVRAASRCSCRSTPRHVAKRCAHRNGLTLQVGPSSLARPALLRTQQGARARRVDGPITKSSNAHGYQLRLGRWER